MYIYIKKSKRDVKSHLEVDYKDFTKPIYKKITKGTNYLILSNGAIGQGVRSINISMEILERYLRELKDRELSDTKPVYFTNDDTTF